MLRKVLPIFVLPLCVAAACSGSDGDGTTDDDKIVPQIAVSRDAICVLTENSRLACVGDDADAILANADPGEAKWIDIDLSFGRAVLLTSDGDVVHVGTSTEVTRVEGGTQVVSTGQGWCALNRKGAVTCSASSLDREPSESVAAYRRLSGGGLQYADAQYDPDGAQWLCGIAESGQIDCWGVDGATKVPTPPLGTFVSLDAATFGGAWGGGAIGNGVCGISAESEIACAWNFNVQSGAPTPSAPEGLFSHIANAREGGGVGS